MLFHRRFSLMGLIIIVYELPTHPLIRILDLGGVPYMILYGPSIWSHLRES
jgi:hypothetical protein